MPNTNKTNDKLIIVEKKDDFTLLDGYLVSEFDIFTQCAKLNKFTEQQSWFLAKKAKKTQQNRKCVAQPIILNKSPVIFYL